MIKQSEVIAGIGEKKSNNGTQYYLQDRVYMGDIVITIATCNNPYYVIEENNMLRIRKLTPKECFRLMGAEDSVYEKLKNAGFSDAQMYHIAGDGLVVNIPQKIFERMK